MIYDFLAALPQWLRWLVITTTLLGAAWLLAHIILFVLFIGYTKP
jgi:hypothetical protein